MQLAPGDFLTAMQMNPDVSAEVLEAMRARFWLDKPAYMQYLKWLGQLLRFDMGHSFLWHAPVTWVIGQRITNTLLLSGVSTLIAWVIALPIGIHSAVKQYSWSDRVLTFFTFVGVSIPNWFLGLLLLYVVTNSGINLPIGGMTSVGFESFTTAQQVADVAKHMVIPVLVLSTGIMASLMRYMRSNVLEVLRQDFITTARAKGLRERIVIYKHAVRNAINPLITLFGFQLGSILSGAALTEIVMNWPGIGSLMLTAVRGLDYYLVMGNLVIGGVMLILGNLIADVLLAVSDPAFGSSREGRKTCRKQSRLQRHQDSQQFVLLAIGLAETEEEQDGNNRDVDSNCSASLSILPTSLLYGETTSDRRRSYHPPTRCISLHQKVS